MPLVRYELRCEHSLANPELFRSAAHDDPEGLLEGVAMAGLVGIVRQLGDLAEFAAEVFRDLHEEFVSVGGRAHDLTVRVQQLEAELPAVEKALLSEPNQLRFAYTNGADWHASIRSDQNHCTSGELPRFVRNFYQECRGPPRLFLLDKFDVAGAGACLKRYSDPSFFKLEWASSELMKAQRAQRDKKARREKKKGRRRKTGQPIAAINQIPARVRYGSASLEDLDTLSHLLASTLKNEVGSSSNQGVKSVCGAQQTQRRSNLGPQNKGTGGPSSPPAQAEGEAQTESVKSIAKDIEANVSGKFYQPSETENVAESMAGKIFRIIEMEDRDALPPVDLIPRNVDNQSTEGAADELLLVSDSDPEAKGSNGVMSMGNGSMIGREGSNLASFRVSESSVPDVPSKGSTTLDAKEEVTPSDLRTPSSSVPDDAGFAGLQEDPSSTSSIDVRDLGQLSGKVSQRNSVDAKEAHVIAAGFPRQNSGRANAPAITDASEHLPSVVGSLIRQFSGVHETQGRHEGSHHSHGGSHRRAFAPTGNLVQSSTNLNNNVTHVSDAAHGVDEQPTRSITEAPAGDGSAPTTADISEGSLLSPAFQDARPSETQRQANNAVDTREVSSTPEESGNNQSSLPPIRIEEMLATSPKVSSQWSSPREDDIRPSISMLSRLSYSSELMPVSSDSEPDSPVSPNSPAFNALYSPPGSPSRILGAMVESPTGIHTGSYSRTADRSRSEIPVLSLSPRSRLASPSPGDHAAPVRPPPPFPIVITVPENPSHLDNNRQEFTSLESQPLHLPSSSLDPELDLSPSSETDGTPPSQSNEEPRYLATSQENAERVHAESAGGSLDNPDLLHIGAHFKVPSEDIEQLPSPVAHLEAEAPSTPAITEPLRSSATHTVDVPSDGPTSNIDSFPTSVGEFDEAYPVSEPLRQCPPPHPASSGVSVQHVPSFPGQAINTGPSILLEDEESVPSSPTGSVIIKDTPSPPGSPASIYSESDPEVHDYHPKSPVSPLSIAHALEDALNHRESGSGNNMSVHEDLAFEASESGPTAAVSVQETTGLVNFGSENGSVQAVGFVVPEDRVEGLASHTSTHVEIPHEEKSLQVSPLTSPHVQFGSSSSPLDSLEGASALRPIPVTTSDVKSQKSSASNSPPDSPPGRGYSVGVRPESLSKIETGVVPSGRSASNSPPTSPPKFLDHASNLRWRGRSDPKPDFSLPPDLVLRSETSSPPCSPPLPSDLESPKQWDEASEASDSSDSSDATQRTHRTEVANGGEVYRLPESPLPPVSPTMSEEGDRLSKPSSRRGSDAEDDIRDDIMPPQEHEMAETATAERADSQLPSKSSSEKLLSEALSSGLKASSDNGHHHQPHEATQVRPPTLEPATEGVVVPDSLDSSQQSTFETPMNNHHTNEAHAAPPLPPAPGSTYTPTQDALAAAIAHHDWNVMKALSFQDPEHRQFPPPGNGGAISLEEIERKDPVIRPAAKINVAAILEKANAIRQAFVGSDCEGDDEDDWSDS